MPTHEKEKEFERALAIAAGMLNLWKTIGESMSVLMQEKQDEKERKCHS